MKNFNRPTMLMILDGFGDNPDRNPAVNAIAGADTPNLDKIFATYPKTEIKACGPDVGLPEHQMGNSEVGHLNIGAGRIVYQELTNITKKIQDGTFFANEAINEAMNHVIANDSSLHLLGLISDGGVHSHIAHLFALIDLAKKKGIQTLYIHCFLDGRDVPPRCALQYINMLEKHIAESGLGKIATVSGRYYAMDRDRRWDRIRKVYNAIAMGEGISVSSGDEAVKTAYERNENDEFVTPSVVCENHIPLACVNNNDAMIMFNFRPDRAREITRAFVSDKRKFDGFERKKIIKNLKYICMTQYDAEMPNVLVAYPPEKIKNTLGEYISSLGLRQLRIAETEKYAHVTFFFNGGVETPNKNEDRILIPSPKVATYDLQPEMSAYLITKKVIEEIDSDKYDVIILNFANPDMVGHTGIMEAAVAAIEALDSCIPRIVEAVLAKNGQILLTADHGNADCMTDKNGNPVTAHSLNDVPLIHIANNPRSLEPGGRLADLAPTLLDLMGIEIPAEMTGRSLLKK